MNSVLSYSIRAACTCFLIPIPHSDFARLSTDDYRLSTHVYPLTTRNYLTKSKSYINVSHISQAKNIAWAATNKFNNNNPLNRVSFGFLNSTFSIRIPWPRPDLTQRVLHRLLLSPESHQLIRAKSRQGGPKIQNPSKG